MKKSIHTIFINSVLRQESEMFFDFKETKQSIEWYLKLDIHQKINLKEMFELLCGVEFEKLSSIFSFSERIKIVHDKLKIEGFEV